MYGKNKILKIVSAFENELAVHSVFYTIQGEGPFAGRAAVFVRLFGCSLACSWCDTDFESTKDSMSATDLLLRIAAQAPRCKLIIITGGEPTRQNLSVFVRQAVAQGYTVQIETAGIHEPPVLLSPFEESKVHIVCSPKTAKINPDIAKRCVFKYIIDAREEADPVDGLPKWAVSQRNQPATALLYRPRQLLSNGEQQAVYVQPLDVPALPGIDEKDRQQHNWENLQRCGWLVMQFGYRLSLQQHKILDLP